MDPATIPAEGEQLVSVISSALTHISTIFNSSTDMIVANPISMVYIAFGLIGAGVALFGRIAHRH